MIDLTPAARVQLQRSLLACEIADEWCVLRGQFHGGRGPIGMTRALADLLDQLEETTRKSPHRKVPR